MFNLFLFLRYTYAIISPTNKIWEKQDKKRCFVLQQSYKGLYFSHLDYLVNSFFSNIIFTSLCFLVSKTRLKYIFVRFLFQWPPGDVILPKTTTIAANNQNWPTTRSILIYRWNRALHRFFPFLVSSQVHSIINFTTFVKHFMIFISLCRYCFSIQCILISWNEFVPRSSQLYIKCKQEIKLDIPYLKINMRSF